MMRVSSIIRADQIAERIGAKLNPDSGYENDVCIYVKPHLKKGDMDFNFEGRKSYIDIVDGHNLGQLAKNYPKVGVIVCSEADKKVMASTIKNEIVVIPQQHCNYEEITRDRTGVKTVGIIGTEKSFVHIPEEIDTGFKARGIEFIKFSKFFEREDIIKFYQSIDIQLVWRPYRKVLSNPLKIVNASSFGIPTIALYEPAFEEVEECYIPVNHLEELFHKFDILRTDNVLYDNIGQDCLIKSDKYHIEAIGKLYKALDD